MRHHVFGALKLNEEDECWVTSREFGSFAPSRITPPGGGKPPSKFEVRIDAEEDAQEPSAEQVKAFQWFLEHEEAVCAKIIDAIFRYYLRLRKDDPQWFEMNDCPEIETSDGLLDLLEFEGLQVRSDHYRKAALLAFSFSCEWDDEHGLAVLAHNDVILDIGGTDLAFSKPSAAGSRWLKACTPKEREAARAILKALRAPLRAPCFPPYQALVIAIIADDEKKVRQLVDKGVDINDVPEGEVHPIFGAIYNSNVKAVSTMLELGANLRVDAHGTTPVQKAIRMLEVLGSPKQIPPGPIRDRMEEIYKRATEVLRLLREAGAE